MPNTGRMQSEGRPFRALGFSLRAHDSAQREIAGTPYMTPRLYIPVARPPEVAA